MQVADHAYNMTCFTLWAPFGKSEQMVWNCLLISKINRRILKGGASIVLVGVVDGVAVRVAQIGGKIKRGVNLKLRGVWLHRLMSGTWSTAWKEKNTWKEIAIKRRGGGEKRAQQKPEKEVKKKESMRDCNLAAGQEFQSRKLLLLVFQSFFSFASLSFQRLLSLSAFSGNPHLSCSPLRILTHASIHAEALMILTPIRRVRADLRKRQVESQRSQAIKRKSGVWSQSQIH